MATFNKEHKEEMGGGKYFEQGIHKVNIGMITAGKTDDGKEYFDVTVLGPNEEEGVSRLWFHTDGAMKYSFNTLRNIFVHNAPESKKDDVRKGVDGIKDTDELLKKCVTMLIGKECWYSVYENRDRKFVGNDGQERYSFDRNIYGYEPNPPKNDDFTSDIKEEDIQDSNVAGF